MTSPRKQDRDSRLAAFETLVSEYEMPLLRYTARLLGRHDAAQDVVQDTFIRLFKGWKDDPTPSPQVASWLYRVAHNCAVDHLRKEARRRLLHLRHADEIPDFALPDRGPGFRISASAEKAVAALQRLPLRERQIVILKVYEDQSYREISDITGLTPSNVGYILHHAMKKMAEELKRARAI